MRGLSDLSSLPLLLEPSWSDGLEGAGVWLVSSDEFELVGFSSVSSLTGGLVAGVDSVVVLEGAEVVEVATGWVATGLVATGLAVDVDVLVGLGAGLVFGSAVEVVEVVVGLAGDASAVGF